MSKPKKPKPPLKFPDVTPKKPKGKKPLTKEDYAKWREVPDGEMKK